MTVTSRTALELGRLTGSQQTNRINYTIEEAVKANGVFDSAVKQFLRDWVEQDVVLAQLYTEQSELDTFIEQGALRSFFVFRTNALQQLLDHDVIAHHLLRPISEVHFQVDAYEPLLARYERRIYNLAAQYGQQEISFRYNPPSRRDGNGDAIDVSSEQVREDIGLYFGTRRSDETALTILARRLRQYVWPLAEMPIHIVTEGYMLESLQLIKTTTEQLQAQGDREIHCFLIQRRHAADDRHLGAALLLMNPEHPDRPQRVVFCDTLNPNGRPPWWDKFRQKIDVVFPQPAGSEPVSDRLEDGGVKLQRLHDGVPVRHQDIDCAFYTFSMVQALISVAQIAPQVILHGSIDDVVGEMTARMPEYFDLPHQPKDPVLVREENVLRRWNTGREALLNAKRKPTLDLTTNDQTLDVGYWMGVSDTGRVSVS